MAARQLTVRVRDPKGHQFTKPTGSRRKWCPECRPPQAKGKPAAVADLPVEREPGPIEAQAIRELDEAGVRATLAGASVLDLARALDNGTHTGSQRATLHDRMLRAAAEAKLQAKPAGTSLDELRARRARRATG